MPTLRDGTVIPSLFGVEDSTDQTPGCLLTMSDGVMRVGEVTRTIPPNDPFNVSKVETEYLVRVNYRDGTGSLIQSPYRCVMKDGFGAGGDHLSYSLRAQDAEQADQPVGNGAIVLIACINADKAQAVIIDCLRNARRKKSPDPAGRFLDFEFNGVKVKVDDAGSLQLQVAGPTDTDGQPVGRDASNKGSQVTLAKNGDITIDDRAGQSIRISPGNQVIEVKAGDHTTETGSWTVKATKAVVVADVVMIGDDKLNPAQHGVVLGQGVDTFSGMPYSALQNSSLTVMAKK